MDKSFAIIADDFTGAGDAAIPFVEAGLAVNLIIPHEGWRGDGLISGGTALDSETRFLSRENAAKRAFEVFGACKKYGVRWFYKKTDSMLRGNPGSEVEAALAATGADAAIVCSAIPGMGRICSGGNMYLHGVPLVESEIGRDQFTPLVSSNVRAILAEQTGLSSGNLYCASLRSGQGEAEIAAMIQSGVKIIAADAENDDDLRLLAKIVIGAPNLLPVGASGLSREIAKGIEASNASAGGNVLPMHGRILAIHGSLTSLAREQAEQAVASSFYTRLTLNVEAAERDLPSEMERLVREIRCSETSHCVLTTFSRKPNYDRESGSRVAGCLGQVARRLVADGDFRVIYSTGGSTSVAVAEALGLDRVTLEQELMPGVVRGRFEQVGKRRWFISKAGGFGTKTTLLDLLEHVSPLG